MQVINQVTTRLDALRQLMAERELDGYIVPHDDAFQSEYLRPADERVAAITGFNGERCMVVVLKDKALLIVPGRDELQAKTQAHPAYERHVTLDMNAMDGWIKEHAAEGARIGYDPMLLTIGTVNKLTSALSDRKIVLTGIEDNLVDAVWTDRPAIQAMPVEIFPVEIAGRTSADKRSAIADGFEKDAAGLLVIKPDSIAWLFNVRGADVPCNPYVLSYAILYADGRADWFVDSSRIPANVQDHLSAEITVRDPASLGAVLQEFGANAHSQKKMVLAEYGSLPAWFSQALDKTGVEIKDQKDPIVPQRAVKSASEQDSIITAHIHDGVAMVRFLKWVDDHVPGGNYTEWAVSEQMHAFRKSARGFRDLSFHTLAAWQENAAIIHYAPTAEKSTRIEGNGFLLVDSGSQYFDPEFAATTDITRTIVIGEPSDYMKAKFTQVLKGHIALASQKFFQRIGGHHLDMIARQHLMNDGHYYPHSTGHGVGCYSGVHESGASISMVDYGPILEGVLVSNEPGYYEENAFGIRTENLTLVEGSSREGDPRRWLNFKVVSLAPIDARGIDLPLMTNSEIAWFNDYHQQVLDTLSPYLNDGEVLWLKNACAPLEIPKVAPAPRVLAP